MALSWISARRRFSLLLLLIVVICLIHDASAEQQPDLERPSLRDVGESFSLTRISDNEHVERTCRAVRDISIHKQCAYTKEYCDDEDDGILSYLSLYYCHGLKAQPFIVILLILWLVFLFSVLGITAGDYLAINLGSIAQSLNMSDTLAGVTFLALGNGAPDVFSTIAAMKNSSDSLAIGELLGAAAFITGVIPGSMALIRSFDLVKSSLIRDAAFLMATIAFLTYVMSDGYLRLWHCLTLLATYILYIVVVMSWHWWLSRRSAQAKSDTSNHRDPTSESSRETDPLLPSASTSAQTATGTRGFNPNRVTTGVIGRTLNEFIPATSTKSKYQILHVAAQTIMLPASIALKFTIPRVEEKTNETASDASGFQRRRSSTVSIRPSGPPVWSRWTTVIQCFLSPQLVIWLVSKQLDRDPSQNLIPCLIALGASLLLSVIILLTSSPDTEPPWHRALCIPGFIVSIAWISMLADEIVAVLKILGIVSNIPDAIMGITVFAFGNSVDDWAANISVARHEHPVMALSACFGGPLFNILLGLSISGIMVIAKGGNGGETIAIALNPSRSLFIVAGTAMLCIAILLVLMGWTGWRMTRPVGYVLTGLWLGCTIVNVVLEATT